MTGPHKPTSPSGPHKPVVGTTYAHAREERRPSTTSDEEDRRLPRRADDELGVLVAGLSNDVRLVQKLLHAFMTGESDIDRPTPPPPPPPPSVLDQTAALTRQNKRLRYGTLGTTSSTVALGVILTHLLAYNRGMAARDDVIAEHTTQIADLSKALEAQAQAKTGGTDTHAGLLACERAQRARLELELGRLDRLHGLQWNYTTVVYDAIAQRKRAPSKPIELVLAEAEKPTPAVTCSALEGDAG